VTAGTGLAGGGTSGVVVVSLVIPVTIGNGGTGATTAPQALQNLGAVAKAGDTMTGPLQLPNGTAAAPGLQFGTADGTGWSRSVNALVMSVQGSTIMGTFAGNAQFYVPLSMLNNKVTQLADATSPADALNMRTGDARYEPVNYADNLGALLWG
jgi:hypothetical protein